ncbi:PAAR domain-containing protein [Kosakonia quasisacchari]|uniref:PAAR domain-containing protein n=1 Tax=Kosakonia quasisacchari TaxID=2529380 RepID=UPI0039E098A7
MPVGYFLRIGDKTTCGGRILSGSPLHSFGGIATARNGDSVSCGKDGKIYHIAGGIPDYWMYGVAAAGTLHSRSTCPCRAKFISSFPNASYWLEEAKSVKAASVAAPLVANAPPPQPAKIAEPEQHAQAVKKKNNFADTCKPEDNPLLNGVYIWTEITDAGHAYVSVHQDNSIYLYTYGRYGRTGPGNLTGDGILDFLQGEDARVYYRVELYRMGARAFRIGDADPTKTRQFFEYLWNKGEPAIQTSEMKETTKRRGHTIDEYDVTGNNCTTHSVEGIKFAGSTVFEHSYTSTTTQIPIELEEDFTIPLSLQRYLETKSSDFSSMTVVEMTDEFKKVYPNKDNLPLYQESPKSKVRHIAAEVAATGDSLSQYSSGTFGGVLGGSYDVDE